MIVKVKSHKNKSYRKLLEYMLHDKDRLSGKGRGFLVTHNLKGNKIDEWVAQLAENETRRLRKRKDSVILTHEILSWHRDDARQITSEKMEEMVREYIRLRNPGGMYLAVPHYDKEHYHVHILVSGIEYKTGKAMRMSRAEFSDLKKNIQAYQQEQFPELSHSVVDHGKKRKARISEKEYQAGKRTGKMTKREEVRQFVESCYMHASSQEDFLERLQVCKLPVYERGGRITGVVVNGKKYRFKKLGIDVSFLGKQIEKSRGENDLQNVRRKGERKMER
ncbi:MAG: hypothetical protein FD123_420 [Bacteroidetes bacterium]|nr:MAG: hypothetical protein FD123_420 [Bacteroidota bacterium]